MRKIFICLFLLSNLNYFVTAQTGPGGVGSAIDNELWLQVENNCFTDAGTTLGNNNAAIQQWNDMSGNNNNAIQTTPAFKPTLLTNQLNGFSTLRFNGTTNRILATGLNSNSEATIIIVVKFNNLTNNNDGIIQAGPPGTSFSATTTNKSIGMWVNTSNGKLWGRGVQTNNSQRNIPQNTTLSTGQFYIISQHYDGSNITQYVNGITAGSVSYDGTLKDWSDFGIGRQSGESLDGDIAEVIVQRTHLNTAQTIIVNNYLAAKYGLTLGTNDLYTQDNPENGNFDFDIAGIGRIDAANIHNDAQGGIIRILNPTDLDDDEFLILGHDNGSSEAVNTSDIPTGVEARFDRTWRVNEVNTSGSAVDVGAIDMQFDLNGLGAITASDLVLLVDNNNDGLFSDETPIAGATHLGGNVYQFSGVTALSNNLSFTLGTTNQPQTPLPVSLLSFEADPVDNTVQLSWSTANETNNDFFSIERSIDAENWEEIITTKGAGNSNQILSYLETDFHPLEGNSYYRLKQTDFDGNYEYFNIVPVRFDKNNFANFNVYPNPISYGETLNLISDFKSNEEILVVIKDLQGRKFYSKANIQIENNELIAIPIDQSIPNGIYFIIATSENKIYSKKLIIK